MINEYVINYNFKDEMIKILFLINIKIWIIRFLFIFNVAHISILLKEAEKFKICKRFYLVSTSIFYVRVQSIIIALFSNNLCAVIVL